MQKNNNNRNIFTQKPFVVLFATLTALIWAFAFPLIKLGFNSFDIANDDIGSKTLFAGIRFFSAGLLTLFIGKITKKKFSIKGKRSILLLILFALVNTSFHYFFFYIGISNLPGSRSAIIDSLSTFFLIILACIVFKNERMTTKKAVGCLLGFTGILLINLEFGSSDNISFSFAGDGMLLMSAICSAFGGVLTRIVTKKIDAIVATGISLALGGLVLTIVGIIMGGSFSVINVYGIIILILLILVSAIGFSLYNKLISCNPVGEIAIFNSLIPVFGAILSCIILKEAFYTKYILASLFGVLGVYIINKNGSISNDVGIDN